MSAIISTIEPDHLDHDAVNDRLYCSHGVDGQADGVTRFDIADTASYGAPAPRLIETLIGADAIEGIVYTQGSIVAANEAFSIQERLRWTSCSFSDFYSGCIIRRWSKGWIVSLCKKPWKCAVLYIGRRIFY